MSKAEDLANEIYKGNTPSPNFIDICLTYKAFYQEAVKRFNEMTANEKDS